MNVSKSYAISMMINMKKYVHTMKLSDTLKKITMILISGNLTTTANEVTLEKTLKL